MTRDTSNAALHSAVREHTTVLPDLAHAGDEDLTVFDDAVSDARVVAIGESTHFVAEFGAAQRRLIRYLAERHGFTVLAHEFGFAEGARLDRWLHGAGGDHELDLGQGPTASSEATRERWRWLREHNTRGRHPMRFVGLDTPGGGGTLRPVLAPLLGFLERADPEAVPLVHTAQEIAHRVEALSQAGSAPLWAQLPALDRTTLTATLSRLSLRMDALRPIYLERTSTAEVDLARRHLDVAMAADHMIAAIHDLLLTTAALPYDTSIRDRLMADSLVWHLDRLDPGDRVVLLAHNLHIQKTTVQEDVTPALTMGSYLAQALGEQYRAIALTHTARSAPAITMSTDDPHGFVVADAAITDPPPTSVEGALAAAGRADLASVLPLAALRAHSQAAPSSIGAQGSDIPCDVADAFDAVLTVPTATMSNHVSLY